MSDEPTSLGVRAARLGSAPRTLRALLVVATLLWSAGLLLGLVALANHGAVQDAPNMAFAAALASLLAGGALAIGLAAAVRSRLSLLTLHLRQEARRAAETAPTQEAGFSDAGLGELRELREVTDELLRSLSERRADLRAAAEAEAKASEALRICVEDSTEGKMLLDDMVFTLVNRAATEILGIPADRLLGVRLEQAFAGTYSWDLEGRRLEEDTWLREILGGPTTMRYSRDGVHDRWVELVATAEADGRILITARDVTDVRRLDSVREEILQLITHDLRGPLTVIDGYLDILRRPLADEARERALDAAKLNAQKMASLLDDLLDATGAEELLQPRSLRPVSLAALAHDVAAALPEAVTHHPLEVTAEGRPIVLGEERRLRQAVSNLVTNALKYSPDGTPVRIHVFSHRRTAILSVEDEGPGVPAEARETVFDRFNRLEAAQDKPGLGLGLYIVRVVAENHHGTVRVEDGDRGGARFVIELPLVDRRGS